MQGSPQPTFGGAAESAFLSRLIASLTVSAMGLCGDASCMASRAHSASAACPDTACRHRCPMSTSISASQMMSSQWVMGVSEHTCHGDADMAPAQNCCEHPSLLILAWPSCIDESARSQKLVHAPCTSLRQHTHRHTHTHIATCTKERAIQHGALAWKLAGQLSAVVVL